MQFPLAHLLLVVQHETFTGQQHIIKFGFISSVFTDLLKIQKLMLVLRWIYIYIYTISSCYFFLLMSLYVMIISDYYNELYYSSAENTNSVIDHKSHTIANFKYG